MKEGKKTFAICYDNLYVFNNKKEAKKYFSDCFYMSEGAEHERYASILADLNFSNTGKDNISEYCTEIVIQSINNNDKYLHVDLDNNLSIDESIKYYEEKIKPILDVSDEYNVDFNSKIPFEYFGSDSESYTNSSFSNYYKEILENFNINIDSIYTEDWSDGKYNITINNKVFDIAAWDDINVVIDNINSMTECLKEKEIEI